MRIGTVQEVSGREARVYFDDTGLMSGWLHILKQGSEWAPQIGDKVVCIYDEGFNANGYVIGVI